MVVPGRVDIRVLVDTCVMVLGGSVWVVVSIAVAVVVVVVGRMEIDSEMDTETTVTLIIVGTRLTVEIVTVTSCVITEGGKVVVYRG